MIVYKLSPARTSDVVSLWMSSGQRVWYSLDQEVHVALCRVLQTSLLISPTGLGGLSISSLLGGSTKIEVGQQSRMSISMVCGIGTRSL